MVCITNKQAAFVREYLVDLNATQAAIRAGYSENTAQVIGAENLSKPYIAEAIQKAMDKRCKRTEITADKVLQELAILAFSDITDYADIEVTPSKTVPGAYERSITVRNTADIPQDKVRGISSIKEGQTGVEIKLYDKLRALELLGKHIGMFTDRIQADITATVDTTLTLDEKLKLIDEIRKRNG